MFLPPPRKKKDLIAEAVIVSLGTVVANRDPVVLTEHDAARHIAIEGGTGGGKSKLTVTLIRQLRSQRQGVALLDPHGSTFREILRSEAARQSYDPTTIHVLSPGPHGLFSFDPFIYELVPGESYSGIAYVSWLAATVDRIVRVIARNVATADLELMNRMKRWLKNVFFACGVAFEELGTHLGLSKALILLDPHCEGFKENYPKVAPHLPDEIRSDFEKLIATKRPQDQEKWVESSINRLRDFLSPLTRLIFDQRAPSINFKEIIQKGHLLLVNLEETLYSSPEQTLVIGGLVLSQLITTARQIFEEERRPFYLFIDEAERYLGEDLRMGFAELRKFKLILALIFQDLSCLQKGELDLVGKVMSQCGIQITFQQQNPDDVEKLAKAFGYPNLDFTPLIEMCDRHRGYKQIVTRSVSFGANANLSHSSGGSLTQSQAHSMQDTITRSRAAQQSGSISQQHSSGTSDNWTHGVSRQEGTSTAHANNRGGSRSSSFSHTNGASNSRTLTDSQSCSDTVGTSESENRSCTISRSNSESTMRGSSDGTSTNSVSGTSNLHAEGTTRNPYRIEAQSHNDNASRGHSESRGQSAMRSSSESQGHARSETIGETNSHGRTDSYSNSETNGASDSIGRTDSFSDTDGITSGSSWGSTDTFGRSLTNGVTHSIGGGTNESETVGVTATQGQTDGYSIGQSQGRTTSVGSGTNWANAVAVGQSMTVSFNESYQPIIEEVPTYTGKLLRSVQDQLAFMMHLLTTLEMRRALVKVNNPSRTFVMEVREVVDPYRMRRKIRSEAWKASEMRRLLAKVFEAHAYNFVPSAAPLPVPAPPPAGDQEIPMA